MSFTAQRNGTCTLCPEPIKKGQQISWNRTSGGAWHTECKAKDQGATPGAITAEDKQRLQQVEQMVKAMTETLSKAMATTQSSITQDDVRGIVAEEVEARLIKKLVIENSEGTKIAFDMAHENLSTLIKLANARNLSGQRLNVYMHGPAGSGKSSAARQMAEALGLSFGYASLNPMTPDSRALGFMHAGGDYVTSEFFKRYTEGGVFCFDEIDNASASFVTTLNSALENGHGAFPHGVFARHKDFVCVCTANTIGRGGDVHYPERRQLDSAFLERFVFLEWAYDDKLTRAIVAAILGPEKLEEHMAWVKKLADHHSSRYPELVISPRAYIQSAILSSQGFAPTLIEKATIKRGLS